ncbi:MAG: VanZ family protein [Geminicoccaceae bacterium]|nr:VanZ family protein [Geminicoccaceae bacterium]
MRAFLLRLLAFRVDRTLVRLAAALVCLGIATAWLEWGVDRLEPLPGAPAVRPLVEPETLDTFGLAERPGRGRVVIAQGAVSLENATQDGIVALDVHLAPRPGIAGLRIAATLATRAVQPAGDWRSGAHLRLVGRDAEGRALYGSALHLVRLVGSRAPFLARQDVQLPAGSVAGTLVIELVRASGRLEVQNLVIQPLRDRPLFLIARAGLIAGWILVGGLMLAHLLRALGTPLVATTLGLAAVASIVLLLMPAAPREALLGEVAELFGLRGVDPETVGDLGHVALFAVLGAIAVVWARTAPLWILLVILALAAPLAEYLQVLTDSRTADPSDALRNLLGAAAGAALGLLVRRRREDEAALAGRGS